MSERWFGNRIRWAANVLKAQKGTPMPPNEPASFTDEDRARFRKFAESMLNTDESLARAALAYVDYLEGALEAADELARAVECVTSPGSPAGIRVKADTYRLARAALPTSKED